MAGEHFIMGQPIIEGALAYLRKFGGAADNAALGHFGQECGARSSPVGFAFVRSERGLPGSFAAGVFRVAPIPLLCLPT